MTERPPHSYEDQYRIAVGSVFRRLRAEQGLSLRDFADRVGTSHTNLYSSEKGETTPGIDVIGGVAAACGLELTEILFEIIDEMTDDAQSAAGILSDLNKMTPAERHEVRLFVGYLRYRASQPSSTS